MMSTLDMQAVSFLALPAQIFPPILLNIPSESTHSRAASSRYFASYELRRSSLVLFTNIQHRPDLLLCLS